MHRGGEENHEPICPSQIREVVAGAREDVAQRVLRDPEVDWEELPQANEELAGVCGDVGEEHGGCWEDVA